MSITFEQVSKRYGGTPVLNDVSLRIEAGEFFVLLGPSGSGKSTLLRVAAGLTDVDHGRISFHSRDVTTVRARDRGVGLVFQHYALFRHMTVGENVEFALRVRRVRRRERARRRDQLLQLVSLEGYESRLPGELSGGQQQRVAVARALAHEPQVLLLDEPFGALDAKIRVELRETIHQVQRRLGMTTILVTHDQEEAFALADRIGIMHNGRLLETGRPETLYRHPATRFVATFLGAANLFLGERSPAGLRLGKRFLDPATKSSTPAHEVVTVVRPEDVEVSEHDLPRHHPQLGVGHVTSAEFSGGIERVWVQLEPEWAVVSAIGRSGTDTVEIMRTSTEQAELALTPGKRVVLGIRRLHLLPTPIASFRVLASDPDKVTALLQAPLLRQLVQSMQAPVLETPEASGGDNSQSGVGVIASGHGSIAQIAAAAAQGRRWLLCVPAHSALPRRLLIHCDSENARSETLRLVASVMRHLHAEATFVSVQSPAAERSEATSAFRRLLDARAELQQTHGLDIRTEVLIGTLADWSSQLAAAAEPVLAVLGFDGDSQELEQALRRDFAALFADTSHCVVLLYCTGAPATARTTALDHLYEGSLAQALPRVIA